MMNKYKSVADVTQLSYNADNVGAEITMTI
jgi:hypothetical protein